MPLKLARDLLQDRYYRVFKRTLEVMMVALPLMLWLSWQRSGNAAETLGVGVFTLLTYLLYALLRTGAARWVPALLVGMLIAFSTWDILAYGSVRTAGSVGFFCAVVAAGIMMRRRALVGVLVLCMALLGGLCWAEATGLLHRSGFEMSPIYWMAHAIALVGAAIGTATSRQLVQRALRNLQSEVDLRTRAEAERARSEQHLRRVFELSPAGILVQSVATRRVLDLNPAFERMFGYTRDEYLGQAEHSPLWMDVRQRDAMAVELLEKGRIVHREILARRRDGSPFHAELSSEIGGTGDERIIVSTISDISAEVDAKRSRELFAKAFDFSPMHMLITRLSDGRILAVNAHPGVQGYTREELLGRSTPDLQDWADPAERAAFTERLHRDGRVSRWDARLRHRNGQLVDCAIWAVVVDVEGEPCALSCIINISEEKRREAVLMDVARGVSGETGEPFFRVLVRSLARALGADMVLVGEIEDEHVQTLALCAGGGDDAPNLRYALAGSPCENTLTWDDMCSYSDRVHELFPQDRFLAEGGYRAYMGMALRDPAGQPIGVLSALWRTPQQPSTDRDALVRIFAGRAAAELLRLRHERQILQLNEGLEQRVAERTAELQATNAELESFAYSVSHDLQTPLRGIDGFTALIAQQLGDQLSAEQQRMFGRVRINVTRMGELIADLLALAKVSKRELRREPVDLSALARQVGESLCQALPERDIRISVAPGLRAHCDRSLASIALENLLGNAIKYTRPRAVAEIALGPLPGQPGVIEIRDNGVGFDMAYADKLFKPFTRLHHENEFEGSGIGLATVHRILERHGGGIEGASRQDAGAVFHFSFDAVPQRIAAPLPDAAADARPRAG